MPRAKGTTIRNQGTSNQWVSVQDAARATGEYPTSIQALAKGKHVKSVKNGRKTMIWFPGLRKLFARKK